MDLLTLLDWDAKQIGSVLELAGKVKKNSGKYAAKLQGKTLAMLFQKTSTRTRCSFEAGMTQLGGHAIYLDWRTTNFTLGSLQDEVKALERYCDMIMARVYKHEDIQAIAATSSKPVINGLCNLFHPCQVLGDLLTVKEKKGRLEGLKLAFLGDGNNVCNSLIVGCSKQGMDVAAATPAAHKPYEKAVAVAEELGKYGWSEKPEEAVRNADVVYTDTWVSMGSEAEKEVRLKAFPRYQVNSELMRLAKPKALFMHCLPAHRNLEVSDEVLDSRQSVVFDQAENRLHVQKVVMLTLLNKV